MIHIEKWQTRRPITTVYFDAEKELHFVKKFLCEITTDKRVSFISESEGSYMDVVTTAYQPEVKIVFNKLLKETKNLPDNIVPLSDFIDVKGLKAQGNQLTKLKVKEIVLTHPIEGKEPWPEEQQEENDDLDIQTDVTSEEENSPTMEWDVTKSDDDQPSLFEEESGEEK
jgi:topoisomerase-4 subunit A